MDYRTLTALELGALLREGSLSAAGAAKAGLDRLAQAQGRSNAFITVTKEDAMLRADQVQRLLDARRAPSPLAGVPMAFKDNICTRGVKTSCASKILGGFTPPYDATVVERLDAAGCISLGKLNMDEFAMGSTSETSFLGPVRNPWDRKRVPPGYPAVLPAGRPPPWPRAACGTPSARIPAEASASPPPTAASPA